MIHSRLCVSSLRRGHANLLCIVPIFADDLSEERFQQTKDSSGGIYTRDLTRLQKDFGTDPNPNGALDRIVPYCHRSIVRPHHRLIHLCTPDDRRGPLDGIGCRRWAAATLGRRSIPTASWSGAIHIPTSAAVVQAVYRCVQARSAVRSVIIVRRPQTAVRDNQWCYPASLDAAHTITTPFHQIRHALYRTLFSLSSSW